MLKVLKELHPSNEETFVTATSDNRTDESRLSGYFCSDIVLM